MNAKTPKVCACVGLVSLAVAAAALWSAFDQGARRPAPDRLAGATPLVIELPTPIFRGTERDIRAPNIEPVQTEDRPPFLVPPGTANVALGKPVSAGHQEPIIGELDLITDGDKEAADGCFVELGPGLQYVTIDLEQTHEIYAIVVWHYHQQPRAYFDVIVQISSDPDFITDVTTVFNNDMDNSAGLGAGNDRHYVDTHFGKLINAKGIAGRYVRLYSNGNTTDDQNHYIEVEVYGRLLRAANR